MHSAPQFSAGSQSNYIADVDRFLDGIEMLPPSPYPLPQLLKALGDPDTDLNKLVDIISLEPSLAAKLLQLCNSAFFSRGTPVNSVREAIHRLGLQTIYRVVASIRGPRALGTASRFTGVEAEDLWRHSVMTAFAAQFIAEDFGKESDLFFTAGLLHDLGKSILAEAYKEKYAALVATARRDRIPLHQLESAEFGIHHAAIGGRLLERWNFSVDLVSSVRFHHEPELAEQMDKFSAFIQVGSAFANIAFPARAGRPAFEAASGLRILRFSMEDLNRYSERLQQSMSFAKALLKIDH
ncbi:MAG TPA: HDOD domain-containing protein [Verrucomicrobiae bacterium]